MRPVADESWMQRAACRGMPTDVFFPTNTAPNTAIAEARKVCARCPVSTECLRYATDNRIPHGVWGGETVKGRQARRTTTTPENLARVGRLSHQGWRRDVIASMTGLSLRQVDQCRSFLRRHRSCLLAPGCGCGCDCRPADDRCDCDPDALEAR